MATNSHLRVLDRTDEHQISCDAAERGEKPSFVFVFVPLPDQKMGRIRVAERCQRCTYALEYVNERLPLWRFARALTRTLHAYWLTYGHRNDLWDDAAT